MRINIESLDWENENEYHEALVGIYTRQEWNLLPNKERMDFWNFMNKLDQLSWSERLLTKGNAVAPYRAWKKIQHSDKLSDPYGPGFGDYHLPFE